MQYFQSAILLALAASTHCLAPRNVRVKDKTFMTQPSDGSTSEVIMLEGPNVVVKGPPYLPGVDGDSQCSDLVDAECQAAGTCEVSPLAVDTSSGQLQGFAPGLPHPPLTLAHFQSRPLPKNRPATTSTRPT